MIENDPRLHAAVADMQTLILANYPGTTFDIGPGEDPGSTWMWARVGVEDPGEVVDLIIEPLLDLQLERGILIDVIPVRTPARIAAMLRERQEAAAAPTLAGLT